MRKRGILSAVREVGRPVFTTQEISAISKKSLSTTTQALNNLEKEGLILKAYRGIWCEASKEYISPYSIIPFLFPRHRAYVSFITALHLHGIIEQIPEVITLASTSHSKMIKTKLGAFAVHQIEPRFFDGFDWYKKEGGFLIAEPEKALVDCLYLSAFKKRQFGHFPEIRFPRSFSAAKARGWVRRIPNAKIRLNVGKKLDALFYQSKKRMR